MTSESIYVFIPGGWHGGWAFDSVTEKLTKDGNKSVSLTLPGLEDQPNISNQTINLDTHIQFVVDFFIQEDITNVILCGHSYAGLVITGVADQIPERIRTLVYIDAYIPKNGDSCWSLTSDAYRELFVTGASNDGYTVAVPPGTDNRRRPQPLATFMQSLRLTGNYQQIPNRIFIYLTGWEGTPFAKQFETLKNSPDWHIETVHCRHNIMREDPDTLVEILKKCDRMPVGTNNNGPLTRIYPIVD
jgi:pimeloyl-ACP methyl ester carboxylesterase